MTIKEHIKQRVEQWRNALVVICVLLVLPYVCMVLWNYLMPTIFSLPEIGYWQALGLLVLSSLFFYHGGHGKST
jgi:hypothetical protein